MKPLSILPASAIIPMKRKEIDMSINEITPQITLLSAAHVIFLAGTMIIAIAAAVFLSGKIGFSKKLVWVCLVIGLLCEMEKIFFFMEGSADGYRLPAEHIPLNLCPFQIFLIFALAVSQDIKKRGLLISYMYPTMFAGGFLGMLLPSVLFLGYHGVFDFSTYRYFLFHGMVVFLGLYLYLSKPVEFNIKSFASSLACLSLVMLVIVWANAFFGWDPAVNFWFLVRPPAENLPILNLDRGWTNYMLQLGWLAVLLFALCYIREIIRDLPGLIKSVIGKIKRQPAR